MSTTRRLKAERKKNLEKIDEQRSEDDFEQTNVHGLKKPCQASGSELKPSEESIQNNDTEAKDYQYEFIMNILRPYKKVVYFLIKHGYLQERTQF